MIHRFQHGKNYTSPVVEGNQGFKVPLCRAFRTATVFKSNDNAAPVLYIPSSATTYRPEAVLLKSLDGENFNIVSEPGMGVKPIPRSLRGFVQFNDRLFMSPVGGKANIMGTLPSS